MIQSLSKTFRFESAHWLPFVPYTHKCSRLHGHSFEVTVTVAGPIQTKGEACGMIVDFTMLKSWMTPLIDRLDHHCLNHVKGLENPTSEVLCQWFGEQLSGIIHQYNQDSQTNISLSDIMVSETCTSQASIQF